MSRLLNLFLYLLYLFSQQGFCGLFEVICLLDLDVHGRCVCKLLFVFYHLQLLADAQEEYNKHQKGKTLLNLVVIGKLVLTAVTNHMQPSEEEE